MENREQNPPAKNINMAKDEIDSIKWTVSGTFLKATRDAFTSSAIVITLNTD